MTLKEQKIAMENSVKEIIQSAVDQKVQVNASYKLEDGVMNVVLIENRGSEEEKNILFYEMNFNEESKTIAITALQRFIQMDHLGPATVVNLPITIEEEFCQTMKNLIAYGIDRVVHPENYIGVDVAGEVGGDREAKADEE